jgi:hypothetical protein
MLIKDADDKQPLIAAMERLLGLPGIDPTMRARIDHEIRLVQAGWRGERDAADAIELHFGHSRNYATIHDLRFELDGQVTQVDHLVISHLLQVWVCASSAYHGDVWINEHGAWTTRMFGRRVGLPSPIDQNRRHVHLLRRLFKSDACPPPRRLGARLTPALRPLVVISSHSRLTLPEGRVDGLETVIKADRLRRTIEAQLDDRLRGVLRVVSQPELERFATDLAALHRPSPIDVEARFGLPQPPAPAAVARAARAASALGRYQPACERCDRALTKQETWFCRLNKRFSGGLYCADCQHGGRPAVLTRETETRTTAQL